MKMHLDLNPAFVERLSAEAKARGFGLEEYAEILLQDAIATHSEPQGILSVGELHAMLHEIAEGADKLPKMPTSAFTRADFYDGGV